MKYLTQFGHRSCKGMMNEKTQLSHQFVCFQITGFSKTVTSEGAVSNNVLYYQQLSFARYQVSFYAENYFSNYQ